MSITSNPVIPERIVDQIAKIFTVSTNHRGQLTFKTSDKTLAQILVNAKILDESECIQIKNFKFITAAKPIVVNNIMLAYTVSLNVRNSIDIDFIFKPDNVEILFKDSLYWKSFYFYSKRQLQDDGNIYDNISPDIIPYMLYGKYITEMEGSVDNNLMELYEKGEQNFKNLLILHDMVRI